MRKQKTQTQQLSICMKDKLMGWWLMCQLYWLDDRLQEDTEGLHLLDVEGMDTVDGDLRLDDTHHLDGVGIVVLTVAVVVHSGIGVIPIALDQGVLIVARGIEVVVGLRVDDDAVRVIRVIRLEVLRLLDVGGVVRPRGGQGVGVGVSVVVLN
jgi:hypothetical protein